MTKGLIEIIITSDNSKLPSLSAFNDLLELTHHKLKNYTLDDYHRRIRKMRRRWIYIRKYLARGERMKKHGK